MNQPSINQKWQIILGSERFEAVVFKERTIYKNAFRFPVEGDRGFIIHGHNSIEVEFDEQHQVFHGVGRKSDIEKHREELGKRQLVHI